MKKFAVIAMTVLLVAGLAGFSAAKMKGRGDGPMSGQMCEKMGGKMGEHMMMDRLASLGLSDTQTAEITSIHLRTKKDVIRKSADLKVANLELKELLAKDPVDMQAVEAKVKQAEGLRTDLRLTHIKAHEEVRSKLTPEQRKKFSAMHEGMGCMEGGCAMMAGKSCGMMRDMDDEGCCGGHGQHGGPAAVHKHK